MDWKKHRLWVALGVLVVLVGLTFVASRDDDEATAAPTEGAVPDMPDLSAAEVDELVVQRPGDGAEAVHLAKKDGAWRMVEPVEADVEATTVQSAVDKLADLEVARVAARNADNHGRLEVTEEQGVRVVAKQAGETLASLIIGSYGGGETMVRLEGEDVVFAVRGSLKFAFDKAPKDWRNRRISDLQANAVREAVFTAGETTRRFVRGDDDTWTQPAGETPIERFSSSKVNSVVSRIAQMRATDFGAPALTPESAGLTEPLARVVLRYRPPTADEEGGDDGEAGDTEAAAEEAPLEERVFVLGRPVEGDDGPHYLRVAERDVIYQVTQYYADSLRPDDEDLSEPEEGEDTEEAAVPPTPGGAPSGDIPPELMRQIQEQMKAQGMGN